VRQAILVVMLVGASFLGGAIVNGPGLQWAKTRLLRSLGLNDSAEIASIDLNVTSSGDTLSDGLSSVQTEGRKIQGLVALMPTVVGEHPTSNPDPSDQLTPSRPSSKSSKGTANSRSSSTSSLPPLRLPTLASAQAKSSNQAAASTDLQVKPAKVYASSSTDSSGAPAILDSLAALLPAAPPASDSSSPISARSPSGTKPVPDGNDEWALLERKMQTLGVSRFMIEAELGGRVMFSCLIPVAGRRAVSQRFEAEGDDMVEAAHAALRRIGLWRSTQAPPH